MISNKHQWSFDLSKGSVRNVRKQIKAIKSLFKKYPGKLIATNEGPGGIDERNIEIEHMDNPNPSEQFQSIMQMAQEEGESLNQFLEDEGFFVDNEWLEELEELAEREIEST